MIGKSLNFLRRQLDAHLRMVAGLDGDSGTADRVVFVEGDKLEPLSLAQGCISMLVVHVMEDRQFRDANPYQRRLGQDQTAQREAHHPDVHLDLSILFVARFKDYTNAWDQLSEVIRFFQVNPLFPGDNKTSDGLALPADVSRLAIELLSIGPEEQQEIWSALRLSVHPALLYRLRLVALRGPSWPVQPQPVRKLSSTLVAITSSDNQRSPPADQSTSAQAANN
mgnify:CR=1 FL=1